MDDLTPAERASGFLSLPAEIRLHIYDYLIPSAKLEIDLCNHRRPQQAEFTVRRRSVISSLLSQVLALDTITRTNGLHLLKVCTRTRGEVLPLLAKTTVRFHCCKCFEELLRNLSYGLGVGVKWMKHVEILLDFDTCLLAGQSLTTVFAQTYTRETMQLAQKTAWLYFGRLDLAEKERWKVEPFEEVEAADQPLPPPTTTMITPATGAANHGAGGTPTPAPALGWPAHVTFSHFQRVRTSRNGGPARKWLISGWFDI